MEFSYMYKGMDAAEEQQFHQYVEQKHAAIEGLLTKFSADGKMLQATCEKFEKHDAFKVTFLLTLHGKSIVAEEVSHSLTKAVDDTKDRLLAQLKKHLEQLKEREHISIRDQENVAIEVETA